MNLLNMLMGTMTSSSSIDALSGKTGTSSSITSSLVSAALPMLLQALTNNASSTEGAQSLLGALGQHTSTESITSQLQNADLDDGHKIIEHILGQNQSSVIQSLSDETGASQSQVNDLLGSMAPAMMSGLSAATTSANNSSAESGFDFTDLMSAFGGSSEDTAASASSASSGLGGLLGGGLGGGLLSGLFGGGNSASSESDESAFDGNSLLSSLTSLMK